MAILFFDNFDDNVLDPTKWGNAPYVSLVEQNGHLEQNDPGNPQLVYAIDGAGIYAADLVGREMLLKISSSQVNSGQSQLALFSAALGGKLSLKLEYTTWALEYEGVGISWDIPPPVPINDQVYQCKIKFVSTTRVEWYIDNILHKTSDPLVPLTIEPAIITIQSLGYSKFNDFIFQDSVVPSGGTKLNCPISMLI